MRYRGPRNYGGFLARIHGTVTFRRGLMLGLGGDLCSRRDRLLRACQMRLFASCAMKSPHCLRAAPNNYGRNLSDQRAALASPLELRTTQETAPKRNARSRRQNIEGLMAALGLGEAQDLDG